MSLNIPLRDWRDRRVWIVGASTGIGAALAEALIDRGARVALSARKRDPLDAIAARSGRSVVVPLDVTDAAAVTAAHDALVDRWGAIDDVLFVAGSYRAMRAWELDASAVESLFDVNVQGAVRVVAAVLPDFLRRGTGRIAIVASVAGYRGLPKALAYGPTKAALINFAEGLHFDLAPKGIAVHIVNPGFVRTPLTDGNDFRMPALIEPAEAAALTLRGMERGDFEIHYPKRFTRWMKWLRVLPYRWFFPLAHRMTGL